MTEKISPLSVDIQGPFPKPESSECEQMKSTKEIGGPQGPEPTRFGDWEQKGRCSDF